MAFIKSIRGKAAHFVIQGIGNAFRNVVFGTALHKMPAFGFHDLMLFLAHGTADIIGLPKAEACQLTEDLHHLFLIDDAAVGNIQNMCKLRRFVGDFIRFTAIAQICGDGIHGAGTIQRDKGNDIFEIARVHSHQNLCHARGFQLKNALGFALCQHLIGGRIVIIHISHRKTGV